MDTYSLNNMKQHIHYDIIFCLVSAVTMTSIFSFPSHAVEEDLSIITPIQFPSATTNISDNEEVFIQQTQIRTFDLPIENPEQALEAHFQTINLNNLIGPNTPKPKANTPPQTIRQNRTKAKLLTPVFTEERINLNYGRDAFVATGAGVHKTKAGDAVGMYLSGLVPIEKSNFGVYGRGELIRDQYKTGYFWAFNMATGVGYYLSDDVALISTIGKCFSNYSTCYFNSRHPTANDDDIDAIYYGFGTYFRPFSFDSTFEVSIDWSPYKGYNAMGLYLGYAFRFK